MSHNKPKPLKPVPQPNICPVCGKSSYSAAGIHPQCAVRRADDLRTAARKQNEASEKPVNKKDSKPATANSRWQKTCPKCKLSLHVRKKQCECGHEFNK